MEKNSNSIDVDSLKSVKYFTIKVNNQFLGFEVLLIRDILKTNDNISLIPLAPKEILGSINLRGKVVNIIDLKLLLNMESTHSSHGMGVVVEYKNESLCLLVDEIGEVIEITEDKIFTVPENIPKSILEISQGIVTYKDNLLILINVSQLLDRLYDNEG